MEYDTGRTWNGMKKYLLDTHTLIWAIVDKNKLSEYVLKILQNCDNQLFVSAVSFWEIAIKHGKGKLGSAVKPCVSQKSIIFAFQKNIKKYV